MSNGQITLNFVALFVLLSSRFPPTATPARGTASLPQHNTSVRQVCCGAIQHVRGAAVICHSLPASQAPAPSCSPPVGPVGTVHRAKAPWHVRVSAARCGGVVVFAALCNLACRKVSVKVLLSAEARALPRSGCPCRAPEKTAKDAERENVFAGV